MHFRMWCNIHIYRGTEGTRHCRNTHPQHRHHQSRHDIPHLEPTQAEAACPYLYPCLCHPICLDRPMEDIAAPSNIHGELTSFKWQQPCQSTGHCEKYYAIYNLRTYNWCRSRCRWFLCARVNVNWNHDWGSLNTWRLTPSSSSTWCVYYVII